MLHASLLLSHLSPSPLVSGCHGGPFHHCQRDARRQSMQEQVWKAIAEAFAFPLWPPIFVRFCMILWFCYLAGWWHDSHVLCFHFAPGAGNSLCYWCAGRSVPATGLEPFASFCLASTSSHLVKLLLRSLRDLNLSRSLVKKGRQTAICCYTSWLVFAPLSWVR